MFNLEYINRIMMNDREDRKDLTPLDFTQRIQENSELETQLINIVLPLNNFCNNYSQLSLLDLDVFEKEFHKIYIQICFKHKINANKMDITYIYNKLVQDHIIHPNALLEKMLYQNPKQFVVGTAHITIIMIADYFQYESNHDLREYIMSSIKALFLNGYSIDKLHITVDNANYTTHSLDSLNYFYREIYYVVNTYYDTQMRKKENLQEEINRNKTAKICITSICVKMLSTLISDEHIIHFRSCGINNIEFGMQGTNTALNHKESIEKLKNYGFKIDMNVIPNLPYSTAKKDRDTFDYIYEILKPDQVKIYTTTEIPLSVIHRWIQNYNWTSYSEVVFRELVNYGIITCPEWVRLPGTAHKVSRYKSNIKYNLTEELIETNDVRGREVRHDIKNDLLNTKTYVNLYNNNNGLKDYFISYESFDKQNLLGFIRLRLCKSNDHTIFSILNKKGLIRELSIFAKEELIGNILLNKAEQITWLNGYNGVVTMSSERTNKYYKTNGYVEHNTYMYKCFRFQLSDYVNVLNVLFCIFMTGLIAYTMAGFPNDPE